MHQHLFSLQLATADRRATADKAGSAVPWLSDWRLKLASGSWQLYQELWMELSGAAAACYAVSGRKRNAALLRYATQSSRQTIPHRK